MLPTFRVTLAQLNPTVGALAANAEKAFEAWQIGRDAGADLVALPEMFLTGYQTQDLVLKPAFVADARRHLESLAARCADGPPLAIGAPIFEDDRLFNTYVILHGGSVAGVARKHHLPNSFVFDEVRLYTHGDISGPFSIDAVRVGTPICEDGWFEDVAETMVESGAEILLVPNGSPYERNKIDIRMGHMVGRAVENTVPVIYLNMVGGQDDQVFDGGSFVLGANGALAAMLPVFDEAIETVTFEHSNHGWVPLEATKAVHPPVVEQEYRLMVEALRDYLGKTGFGKVLLGLSGGVDSALVASIAADAIGPENVRCVMLPSRYTSETSLEDAAGVAERLGVRLDTVPIGDAHEAVLGTLQPLFNGHAPDVTEENVQSRLRGLFLMALSNKFGEMLLTTGNKSEVAVGYATIYGDMSGGYNPIKDLYKTRVFETCLWRNAEHRDWMKGPVGAVMPERVISKPPTAELREDQKDEDSLPPYEVLDAILDMLIEQDASVAEIVDAGFDRAMVKKVEHLLYISEYKRFQSAPGARLTSKAFWLDRRYPIANRWRDPS